MIQPPYEVTIRGDAPTYTVMVDAWHIGDPPGFVTLIHTDGGPVEFIPTTAIRSVLVPNLDVDHEEEQ